MACSPHKYPVLLIVGLLIISTTCSAAEFNTKIDIGDAAPSWQSIPGTDEQSHGLDDYKSKKLIVTVFTCNTCPVAVDYEDRLIALQKEYADKDVQIVAINVNTNKGNRFDEMKQRAADKNFNFPYLYDESQQSARDYGASVTPHVFVLDEDRNVAYMGAIDDHRNESKVKKRHLKSAIDALLAGKTPTVTDTRQFGCGIKFKKK